MSGRLPGTLVLIAFASAAHAQDTLAKQASAILQKTCVTCHGIAKASGLDLRTRESLLAGGTRGPVVRPFNAERSLLLRLVSREDSPAMPPGRPLDAADIATLRRWVEAGALFEEPESTSAAAEKRK